MNLACEIESTFGLPTSFIKLSSENEAICMVHKNWLNFLQNGCQIPQELLSKDIWEENLFNHFFTPQNEQLHSWKLFYVYRWNKSDSKAVRFSRPHKESNSVVVHLSYSQLIHYVSKANYKNLWEQAWRKYHMIDNPKRHKHKQDHNEALREILKRIFKLQSIVKEDGKVVFTKQSPNETDKDIFVSECTVSAHPNLLGVPCAVENEQSFLLLSNKIACTLKDCLMFSPFVLNGSTMRPLFVIFQLLQALRSVHNQGLFMGPITLSDINVLENLWIHVKPLTSKALICKTYKSYLENQEFVYKQLSYSEDTCISSSAALNAECESNACSSDFDLSSLVCSWVDGNISNYDYLIALNRLAGRERDNPHCHYVMPWIMDFTVPDGGWRDLTKSKFRLNKGDKQLDLIYESSVDAAYTNTSHSSSSIPQVSAVTVPHHTSEVLADITYYVYKARRISKSLLCQHVRQKWVPAEYPSTIERLQEWTPDECIPEFFSEPEIFYSIHPDLSDLGVPWWCDSPEDFIKKHRDALEGSHVSERLHHWIDLVFGFKMTGSAALKSKNICLPLVDQHISINNYGMIQLFNHPHPHKLSRMLLSRNIAPKTFRSMTLKVSDTKDSGDDDTSSESISKSSFLKGLRSKPQSTSQDLSRWETRPETQIIILPKDFNPLSSLTHFESLFSFLSWAGGKKINKIESQLTEISDVLTYHFQVQDLCVLGCLISEIGLFNQCKTLPVTASLEERYNNCLKLLRMYKQEVPRSLQNVIQLLLQVTNSYQSLNDNTSHVPNRYPPISSWGLPLPSPHQLLIPSIPIIPFPAYFSDLYSFLYELNNYSKEISNICEEQETSDMFSKVESIAEKKVCFAAEKLVNILPALNNEGIELLIPYIKEMFQNQYTSLLSSWHLFRIVAQALGPQLTCKHLLSHLTKVFDADRPSPKHLKLYHRSFLLQLIVGLGLHNFLTHFTTVLIEAIGGCKDYSLFKNETDYMQKSLTSDLNKLDCMQEEVDEYSDDTPYEDCLFKANTVTKEELQLQPEISHEEDNEIFDLDINDEDTKDNTVKEFPHIYVEENIQIDEKLGNIPKTEEEMENINFPYLPVGDTTELDDNNALSADPWNSDQDFMYSQSAPASTSQLSEWMAGSGDHLDKKEFIETAKPVITPNDYMAFESSQIEQCQNYNVSDVSAESMLWLTHRLGPVLTARYLTRNLLRMLTLCYDSPEKREIVFIPPGNIENTLSINCKWFRGDLNAFKVLDCLSRIASLYGEQFIMLQYVKHIADLLNLCRKRIPVSLESGLHGAMSLLHHIVPYISDKTLMDHLQDVIIKDILLLVLRLISSMRITYPSGSNSRMMIAYRMLDVIYTIGLRIGIEMTRKHLCVVLQKFFICFDKVYNENCEFKELDEILGSAVATGGSSPLKEQALIEMRQTFTPELAFLTYIPFCKLTGGIHMEKMLKNDDLIQKLCVIHDKNTELSDSNYPYYEGSKTTAFHMTHHRDRSLGQDDSFVTGIFGKNVNVIGNRLDVHLGDESQLVVGTGVPVSVTSTNNSSKPVIPKYDISLIKRKMDNSCRHLKGNWLAYWEHETGRSEKDYHFDFKQIKLQTFIGHSGTVRNIHVLDNENSFLTSSKDKTVKLWSLRSCGDGSAQIPCQWTYNQHRKSVFAVSFLDSLRLVGSCDSTVHIWDPFLGSCVKQLEPTKGSPITVLTAMPAPSTTFLAATTNSTIKFLDARTCRYMHEFKVSIGTTGLIRCLAVSPNGNWLAVGHSTGMISVLDVRTGFLLGTWLGHEGEVLQLKAFNNTFFVSSSLDHSLTTWKYEDTQVKCQLKGPMEPVISVCFYGNEVISGTTGNRVGLHSSIDKRATYTYTRLRSDTFKGMLTTMAILPLNRLLLLGTDNGNVVLLS